MRVSNTVVVLASFSLWLESGGASGQQRDRPAPRANPSGTVRLYWPFLPGETWKIERSWGAEGAHDYFAMDIVRSPRGTTAGSAVRAAGNGRVVFAGNRGMYGLSIDVDHGNGYGTRYAHLQQIDVQVGKEVKLSNKIGIAGSTGRSTGPHLHFEVRRVDGGRLKALVDPTSRMYPPQEESLAGIAASPRAIRFAAEDIHPDDQRALAEDVAKLIQQALGGKPTPPRRIVDPPPLPRVEPVELATPNRRSGLIPEARAAETPGRADSAVTLVAIQFTPPEGSSVASWNHGVGGTGMTVKGGGETVTVLKHPGFPGKPYTPQGVADSIIRISWMRGSKQGMTVGTDGLPGLRLVGPDGIQVVLFTCRGGVYMISNTGSGTTLFSRIVESVSAKK